MDVPLKFAYELSLALVDERVLVPGAADIRLDAVASISCHRTAAAKSSNGISAGVQRADRVGRCVNSRWILHGGTTRPRVLCGRHHHDTSSSLCFHSSLQRVKRTTFRSRALPGVVGDVRRLGRVGIAAADPRRRKEPLHALDIPGRRAIRLRPCYGNRSTLRRAPSRSGYPRRHRRPWCRWCACREHSRRKGKANRFRKDCRRCHEWNRASYNRDRRFGRPSRGNAALSALCVQRTPVSALGYNNVLSGEPKRPYLGRMRVIDARFDGCRTSARL